MDIIKSKWKNNLIAKAWRRCNSEKESKWCEVLSSARRKGRGQVAPEGCFSVYVGPERQRFAVKTEFANHALFRMLLEDAESEYGYNCQGPIMLPCDVDLFCEVLAAMESSEEEETSVPNCGIAGYGSLILCSPARRLNSSTDNKGYGGGDYRILSPSRMLKINQF